MFEQLIAYYCSPALAGIKPSNIMNCSKKQYPEIKDEISRLNGELNNTGIYIDILCECKNRVLIMIYRKDRLDKYLHTKEIKALLDNTGYKDCIDVEEYIIRLREKIIKQKDFPHEIGAFLGYPICDIYGFISNKKQCLYTGYWKVYDNVAESKMKFQRYDLCRNAVLKRIESGRTLASLFAAAQ